MNTLRMLQAREIADPVLEGVLKERKLYCNICRENTLFMLKPKAQKWKSERREVIDAVYDCTTPYCNTSRNIRIK